MAVVMADAPYESKDDPTVVLTSNDGNQIEPTGDPRLTKDETDRLNDQTRTFIGILLATTLTCAICLIIGLEDKETWVAFAIIEIVTIVIGLIAAYNIYQWEMIKNEITYVEGLNASLESSKYKLKTQKSEMSKQVNMLRGRIKILNADLVELETQLAHFDTIRREIRQSIDLTNNNNNNNNNENKQRAEEYVDSLNNLIDEMKRILIENEKAYLYELYYTMEYRDKTKGLSKNEYSRLLTRLPEKSRNLLVNNQTFEQIAGGNNVISLLQFQRLVANYLSKLEQRPLNELPLPAT